ncbi:hypothetical protein JAAARDRAFT_313414 [Jaapia argillacea MUCL 33604]|uniref:Uncharacterized protein n=1 Tax=Jaapia argillacea MUCL 33604 TaxID=933084 RepID=A0A067PM21_9AGAM|nr:hypothetical protein JAAARDRAFT_313414 [Jaapia argillacea MUCL 33604]
MSSSKSDSDDSVSSGYVPRSDYAIKKSFGGHRNFMGSHGLKMDEFREAKAILDRYRECDKFDYL